MLCDTDHRIGEAYGAYDPAKPEYARRIAYLIGTDGTIEKTWAKVDVKTHADEVLAAV